MKFFYTMLNDSLSTVYNNFAKPALQCVADCPAFRVCPELSDSAWVSLGLQRAIHESATGRAFLQTHGADLESCPDLSHYFHTLKSARRLRLLQEVNQRFAGDLKAGLPDELAGFPQLDNFDVYAGDGHWHQAASHEPRLDAKIYATGHFYALDLRRRTLARLATAQGKKEHDLHALKRLTKAMLRHCAPVGRQVLYVWDKAVIDFRFWDQIKSTSGIYFISLEKENSALEGIENKVWDHADPINYGVLQDERVSSSEGVLLRRVTCQAPDTGEIRVFLTTELTLPPGLIAHLYHRRWQIEKVFDCLKNKLNEKKSWATSPTAKAAQAEFLCLTHNLIRRLEHVLASQEGVINKPDGQRHAERLAKQKTATLQAGRRWPSTWATLSQPVQYSVKLIRWLRACFQSGLAWATALPRLRALYASL
ncbi:MAG: transposase [Verrucomicrobiota bacterium]